LIPFGFESLGTIASVLRKVRLKFFGADQCLRVLDDLGGLGRPMPSGVGPPMPSGVDGLALLCLQRYGRDFLGEVALELENLNLRGVGKKAWRRKTELRRGSVA
jgi:hypothetical protein